MNMSESSVSAKVSPQHEYKLVEYRRFVLYPKSAISTTVIPEIAKASFQEHKTR